MNKVRNVLSNRINIKNLIIFGVIAGLTIHSSFVLLNFAVNVPMYDEILFIPFVVSVNTENSVFEWNFLEQLYDQRPIVPQLLMMLNVILFSWNIIIESFIGLTAYVVLILVCYKLLKNIDEKLTWAIIPISILTFNAGHMTVILWGLTAIFFPITVTFATLSIYYINKPSRKSFYLAILFGFLASFTQTPGLLVWLIGPIALFYQRRIRSVLIWVLAGIACFGLYFYNYEFGNFQNIVYWDTIFSLNFVKFFADVTALSVISPITIFNTSSSTIIGTIVLFISGIGIIYMIVQKKIPRQAFLPWIQIALFSGLSIGVITLGRIYIGASHRYTPFPFLLQIFVILILSMVLLSLYYKRRRLFYVCVIILAVMLCAYTVIMVGYATWEVYGPRHNVFTTHHQECLLNQNLNKTCNGVQTHPLLTEMLENSKLSLFVDDKIFVNNAPVPLLNANAWNNLTETKLGAGSISFRLSSICTTECTQVISKDMNINNKNFNQILLLANDEHQLKLRGTGTIDGKEVDEAYLVLNDDIYTKLIYGYPTASRDMNLKELQLTFTRTQWEVIIQLYDLTEECYEISVRLVKDDKYYIINHDTPFCFS